jgi:hypothetical protein
VRKEKEERDRELDTITKKKNTLYTLYLLETSLYYLSYIKGPILLAPLQVTKFTGPGLYTGSIKGTHDLQN